MAPWTPPPQKSDPRFYFEYRDAVPHCVLMDRETGKEQLAVDPKVDGTCDYDVMDYQGFK